LKLGSHNFEAVAGTELIKIKENILVLRVLNFLQTISKQLIVLEKFLQVEEM
jgi:hypothetical protein